MTVFESSERLTCTLAAAGFRAAGPLRWRSGGLRVEIDSAGWLVGRAMRGARVSPSAFGLWRPVRAGGSTHSVFELPPCVLPPLSGDAGETLNDCLRWMVDSASPGQSTPEIWCCPPADRLGEYFDPAGLVVSARGEARCGELLSGDRLIIRFPLLLSPLPPDFFRAQLLARLLADLASWRFVRARADPLSDLPVAEVDLTGVPPSALDAGLPQVAIECLRAAVSWILPSICALRFDAGLVSRHQPL